MCTRKVYKTCGLVIIVFVYYFYWFVMYTRFQVYGVMSPVIKYKFTICIVYYSYFFKEICIVYG